eukprot:m.107264 g.107264  ORF g.107264 m.107264 type:complete len:59 (+) comp12744_c0_seq1:1193-1369(+)
MQRAVWADVGDVRPFQLSHRIAPTRTVSGATAILNKASVSEHEDSTGCAERVPEVPNM